jgi:chorismate mutase
MKTRTQKVSLIFTIVAAWVTTWQIAEATVARARPNGQAEITSPQDHAEPLIEDLLGLMGQRLLLMHDVARAKWNTKTPLTDPEREKLILREVAAKGRAVGMEAEFTCAFFAAQIEASKLIESEDFRRWEMEQHGPFADALELKRDVRPRIDALNAKLLAALVKARPVLRGHETTIRRLASKAVEGHGITPEVRAKAIRPLMGATSNAAGNKPAR